MSDAPHPLSAAQVWPLDDNLFSVFERQALSTPHALAVAYEDGECSYAQLLGRARAAGSWMRSHGVAHEQTVAVLMPQRPDLVALALGILQAGGCVLPIDPLDPPERVAWLLRSAGARWLVGDAALLAPVREALDCVGAAPQAGTPAAPPRLIDAADQPRSAPDLPVQCAKDGSRLACLIFSPAAGAAEPQGVELEHRSVVNLLCAVREMLAVTPQDRWLAVSSAASERALAEWFVPLISGAALVLRAPDLLRDPRRLADTVRRQRVTLFHAAPSVWSTLFDAASDLPRLRVALCSGAGLAPALAMRLTAQAEQAWNLHGPTEAAGWAIAYRLDPMPDPTATPDAQAEAGDLMPIGWPLANLYALVVNEHGLPVPDGGHGELWLSGLGLARGYRGKAALTSQCFPESGPVGERCFRGGTRVRRDTQGALHWAPSSRPAAAVGATPRARRQGLMAVLCGLLRRSNRLRAAAGTLLGAERCHRPGR